jgi:hypothetical protein
MSSDVLNAQIEDDLSADWADFKREKQVDTLLKICQIC